MSHERRTHRRAELRVEGDARPTLVGYAVVYNSLSEDLGCFREIIAPGAFSEALKTADVRCLIDHNPSLLLGRNTSGTLRLFEESKGLRIECDLDDTSYALDLAKTVRRGDRDGMSFGFEVVDDSWGEDEIGVVRTVQRAGIFDVSAVTYPAYKDSSLNLRDTSGALRSLEAWKHRPDSGDESRQLRLRINLSAFRP
jgi:Escherichia/Staphylococcus phage prohead protease